MIIGVDLIFTLRDGVIWGHKSQKDSLFDYFIRILDEFSWFDINPIKLRPLVENVTLEVILLYITIVFYCTSIEDVFPPFGDVIIVFGHARISS